MKVDLFKKCVFLLTLFCLSTSVSLIAQTANEPAAQQLLDEAVAAGKCAGIAAGFNVDGRTEWIGSAGQRDIKKGENYTPLTLSRIASISKTMTAVAVLQLYERGKISLDVPIQTYLPEFPRKGQGDITVRQLLQHSSGIDGYRSDRERENKKDYASLEEACKIFQDRDLVHQPGSDFHYTTYGYVVLGRIVEAVADLSFAAYLQKNIWEPAGMTATGVERAGQTYPGKSALYHLRSGKKLKAARPTNLSDRVPGGGIYSNVPDLLHFGQALLTGKLLKESTLEMMWQNPQLKKEGNGYGMGWYLYGDNPRYGPVYGHNGAQTGASTFLMLLPEVKTTIVVLANTSGAMSTVTDITIQLFDLAAAAE